VKRKEWPVIVIIAATMAIAFFGMR